MDTPYQACSDIYVLPSVLPLPGMGILPVNAFLIKATEPVLVDTGMGVDSTEFMQALRSVIDPRELKWLWLTHDDADHTGSIERVLEEAPGVRVITTYLGFGKLSLYKSLPLDRLYFLNVGETIRVGDRTLTAIKPPVYDSPASTGFFDDKSKSFFCADSFGAFLQSGPVPQDVADVPEAMLKEGQAIWATVDSPWLQNIDATRFAKILDGVRQMAPEYIFSAHIPPARGKTAQFLNHMASFPGASPWVGPDQQALEAMLAQALQADPPPISDS